MKTKKKIYDLLLNEAQQTGKVFFHDGLRFYERDCWFTAAEMTYQIFCGVEHSDEWELLDPQKRTDQLFKAVEEAQEELVQWTSKITMIDRSCPNDDFRMD